ncbi:adenylosuccinate lyase [Sporomusa sp.]|uniref:adenylosuccinate lyase n=1 Tax=Sporomusa sp. TaxID=2078658 RepID=UPI002BE539C7|nr:adenylosuccinate lyase [Sporomusa sp.]HWR10046.1 adenylosuccinate lyase [Sporomusa sp.]
MACTMIESELFRDVFSTAIMREIWDDRSIIQHWLDIEAALAESQAELGIIPSEIAREITEKAKVENLDFTIIRQEVNKIGHSLVPTLREFQRQCKGKAGEYIHLGATTQDIIDTGFVLAAKKAFAVIYDDLYEVEGLLINLAEEHKATVMAGRTHGQQALPITFGYKVAVWASEIHRHLERMQECRVRDFVGQLSGAVGTMAGFGEQAIELQIKVMSKLGLKVPEISWHASRDRLVSVINLLALIAGTLGKIGNEIVSLQKTEVSELAEPWADGVVGSSTMPHKRNPGATEGIHTLSKLVKGNLLQVHEALLQEHERDGAYWKIEWVAIPEAFIFTAAAVAKAKKVLKGLVVNKQKMEQNLDILQGLLLSEAAMLHLGEKLGKQTAHKVVYEISMNSFRDNASFKQYLLEDSRVNSYVTAAELDQILNPHNYTGFSRQLTERVVANIKQARSQDNC